MKTVLLTLTCASLALVGLTILADYLDDDETPIALGFIMTLVLWACVAVSAVWFGWR